MRIKRLELKNFRGFEELIINFPEDSNVAVFVGVNGSGKTSVLEGIVKLLDKFIFDLKEKVSAQIIFLQLPSDFQARDLKNGQRFISNRMSIEFLQSSYEQLHFSDERGISDVLLDIDYWERLSKALFEIKLKNREVSNHPIISFQPTDRNSSQSPSLESINLEDIDIWNIYRTAFNSTLDYKNFFQWFRSQEDVENEQIRFTDNSKYRSKELEAVRKAISLFLPNFSNPRVQRQPQEELIVEKNGEKLSISNLSHGERLMFAMVGDIARRLSIANPGLDDPLQGEGLVLIDEIELHLHPGWQRQIIPKLTETFPNIQFILTTHSPQVISSVERESVFVLKNFKLVESPFTLGRDSNSILHDVFDVEERPEVEADELTTLYHHIDKEEVEKATDLLDKLREKLGDNDVEIQRAETYLSLLTD